MDVSVGKMVLAAVTGAALGIGFFGGLLWTVRRLPNARHPLTLAFASFLVRTAGFMAVMVWLLMEHWVLACVALAVFLAVRIVMVRSVVPFAPQQPKRQGLPKEIPWT